MQKPSLIHLENALPPLAEMGLEHLVPVVLQGGAGLDPNTLAALLGSLALGAQKHAFRRLVAVARATDAELFDMEMNPAKEAEAQRAAALLPFDEAKEVLVGFFSSLGLSLSITPASSETSGSAPAESPAADAPEVPTGS